MKLLNLPRQPFVGLAGMAGLGIILADFSPLPSSVLLAISIVLAVCGVILLRWPMVIATYAIVGLGFFLLHDLQTSNTDGQQLAAQLGDRRRVLTATGIVVSEPKIAPNGFATFLLRLQSIELEGGNERTGATWLVRWRGTPEYADELRLFGIAGVIPPPRNPGEFDMRAYLARRDVRRTFLFAIQRTVR
jgi:competence protein ComEC